MHFGIFNRKEVEVSPRPKTETPAEREERFQQILKDDVTYHFDVWQRLSSVKQRTDIDFLSKVTTKTETAPCVVDAAKERVKELKSLRKTNIQARSD